MERLTEWNGEQPSHAYYPSCFKAPCYGDGCKINDCLFETAACDRLAAYEDTGLTPEKIKAPFTEDAMINLAAQALGVEPSRLREIAEADKDGRCVVLPCKVGGTVYMIERIFNIDNGVCDEICARKVIGYGGNNLNALWLIGSGGICNVSIFLSEFGKTVSLTREEAEKALRGMEGKKDG